MRTIFVAISDLQCGHRFGLLSPETKLDPIDEYEDQWSPKLTAIQRQLWKWFTKDRFDVIDLAGDDEIVLLVLGDVTHGTTYGDDLISPRISDQYTIAIDALSQYISLSNLSVARLVKGTPGHSMKQGSSELVVASVLRKLSGKDIHAWYHLSLKMRGIYFDLAHKGPTGGSRSWLEGNELRYYIKSIMDKHEKAGEKPPDVILRGHYHDRTIELVHDHTWKTTFKTWGAIVPAYGVMADDYTRSITKSKSHMTAGTLAIEVIDGRVKEIYDLTHVVDIRRREVLR